MPERRTVVGPPERGWPKAFARIFGVSPDGRGTELNRLLVGYPSNHNYRIDSGKILPSRQLHNKDEEDNVSLSPRHGQFPGYRMLPGRLRDRGISKAPLPDSGGYRRS
jgi:hypothetical protein